MLGDLPVLLLEVELPFDRVLVPGKTAAQALKGAWPVIAAGLVLGLILLLWARRYVRKKKRHSHSPQPAILAANRDADSEESSGSGRRHRRRRKRRRDHRPRNPSLADTGGLPPARGPDVTPPQVPQT